MTITTIVMKTIAKVPSKIVTRFTSISWHLNGANNGSNGALVILSPLYLSALQLFGFSRRAAAATDVLLSDKTGKIGVSKLPSRDAVTEDCLKSPCVCGSHCSTQKAEKGFDSFSLSEISL